MKKNPVENVADAVSAWILYRFSAYVARYIALVRVYVKLGRPQEPFINDDLYRGAAHSH